MAIGDGMLAQALLDYFDQHTEEFEKFLLDRAAIGDGYVIWKGDKPKGGVVTVVSHESILPMMNCRPTPCIGTSASINAATTAHAVGRGE